MSSSSGVHYTSVEDFHETSLRIAVSCLAVTLLASVSRGGAQVAQGQSHFGSYGGGPFDVVNLGSLNASFKIPIVHKNGRGLPFVYDLICSSSVWRPVTSGGTKSWTPAPNWGWTSNWGGVSGYLNYSLFDIYCYDNLGHQTGVTHTYSGWTYHDPWTGQNESRILLAVLQPSLKFPIGHQPAIFADSRYSPLTDSRGGSCDSCLRPRAGNANVDLGAGHRI